MVAKENPVSYNKDRKTATALSRDIDAAQAKIQYDKYAKRILGNKQILSRIFQRVVPETSNLSLPEIEECIEKLEIDSVSIYPGLSNHEQVQGINTESAIGDEGKVTFDVRTYIRVPKSGERIKIIINLEGQKKFNPGYRIETRGIFYCARQLSMQLDTEFFIPDYDGICKVYSIWICFDSTMKESNAISEYKIQKSDIIPGIKDNPDAYDKMSVIIITLNEKVRSEDRLINMLNVLFSQTKMSSADKKENLRENYGLNMSRSLGEEVDKMCNFSDLVEERGIQQGFTKGINLGVKSTVETCRELGSSYEKAVSIIMDKFTLSHSEAEAKVQEFWKN